ncbi:MAG: MBOAT family protein [Bacteroidetes bacterium]|nr:MBOAT family protein [Bacteroidota bacterium]
MLFNSFPFFIFLPIAFIFYWLLNDKYRWILLLAASYYFYSGWGLWYVMLLASTTIIDYFIALQIEKAVSKQKKKLFLIISLSCNLLVLLGFKYFTFLFNSGAFLMQHFDNNEVHYLAQIVIPVGLSFYTFQSIAYSIDVYRGEVIPEKNIARFALFVSFFPQLVAGPVERFNNLMPQLKKRTNFVFEMLFPAIRIAVWGFFKKMVIADRLAEMVDPIFKNIHLYSGSTLLFAGFLFAVQVYCDFSGYTDIATGVAKLFGIQLSLNWRRPLLSSSLIEFWKRNHISITSWFRNYLYIPLGGNKVSYGRWLFNIFLVFLISGLWHGASWTFVLWGAMHGVLYCIELVFNKKFPNLKWRFGLGHVYLLLFHTVSIIAFRAASSVDLFVIYHKIISSFNIGLLGKEVFSLSDTFSILFSLGMILFLFMKELQEETSFIRIPTVIFSNYFRPAFYICLFISIFLFGNFNSNQFIYFRF